MATHAISGGTPAPITNLTHECMTQDHTRRDYDANAEVTDHVN
jgi:hypothetical protein